MGPSDPLTTRPLSILIVEDDEQTQRMMAIILARAGHHLVFCFNGNDAVQIVKSQQFDLVFMDVQMPLMDGFEATRQIRKWEVGKRRLPIVGITAIFDSEYRNCFQAGMDDVISKPFDTGQIYQTIAACLHRGKKIAPHGIVSDDSMVDELPILDMSGAAKRLGADQKDYRELLDEFMLALPGKVQQLVSDFNEGQWDILSNHAHNLKGLSASLGAARLSRNALDLERFISEGRHDKAEEMLRKIEASILALRSRVSGS